GRRIRLPEGAGFQEPRLAAAGALLRAGTPGGGPGPAEPVRQGLGQYPDAGEDVRGTTFPALSARPGVVQARASGRSGGPASKGAPDESQQSAGTVADGCGQLRAGQLRPGANEPQQCAGPGPEECVGSQIAGAHVLPRR